MYLSRLILNSANTDVQRDLADCHALHRTILTAFPAQKDRQTKARENYSILYRMEFLKDGTIRLYVQSAVPPNWPVLKPGYLYQANVITNPAIKEIDTAYGNIREGMIMTFTLRANPTRKVGTTSREERLQGISKNNGRRIFINNSADQTTWLEKKAQRSGFSVLSVTLREDTAYGRKKNNNTGDIIDLRFDGITYQGYLRVTDSKLLVKTLEKGIGSGKAYGFGLLSVAPAGR